MCACNGAQIPSPLSSTRTLTTMNVPTDTQRHLGHLERACEHHEPLRRDRPRARGQRLGPRAAGAGLRHSARAHRSAGAGLYPAAQRLRAYLVGRLWQLQPGVLDRLMCTTLMCTNASNEVLADITVYVLHGHVCCLSGAWIDGLFCALRSPVSLCTYR
ncbi:hypothetical protein PLICRDRAFT_616367 [Plicaturopsis crispa FD-325 SS-3]|nr:hypothetical protein PLICRDRAFT_616367 [Plicaturopsis crispa FD-325 SS-3]